MDQHRIPVGTDVVTNTKLWYFPILQVIAVTTDSFLTGYEIVSLVFEARQTLTNTIYPSIIGAILAIVLITRGPFSAVVSLWSNLGRDFSLNLTTWTLEYISAVHIEVYRVSTEQCWRRVGGAVEVRNYIMSAQTTGRRSQLRQFPQSSSSTSRTPGWLQSLVYALTRLTLCMASDSGDSFRHVPTRFDSHATKVDLEAQPTEEGEKLLPSLNREQPPRISMDSRRTNPYIMVR